MRGPEPAATAKDPVRPTSPVEVAEDRTERGARFAYAARDAIYSMARAAELASSEESLSTVPEPTLVAAAVQRPATEAPKAPAVAREPESRSVPVEDLGQSLREDLGRRRGPSSLAPIRVPSEREKTPPGVILLTPM